MEMGKRNFTINLVGKLIKGLRNDGTEKVESNEANNPFASIVFFKLFHLSHSTTLLYILFTDSSKIEYKGRRY